MYLDSSYPMLQYVTDLAPDAIIIHAGSNDLSDSRARGEVTADRLIGIAQEMKLASGAGIVMICTAIKRGLGRYLPTEEEVDLFNLKVVRMNMFLRVVGPTVDGVDVWRHRGLTLPQLTHFTQRRCAYGCQGAI